MNRLRRLLMAGIAQAPVASLARAPDDPYATPRARMVAQIELHAQEAAADTGRSRLADAVIAAVERVPRHEFVPPALVAEAYGDHALPIGQGQTISQPFIVALMTDLLEPSPGARVLEVGTGSGYHAAVLARCFARVYTVEIVASLGEAARRRLATLGYRNVEVRVGDGYLGWPEAAPFQAILVTAAPDHVPRPLLDQLAPGGRMVIPVGPRGGDQDLVLIRKDADGSAVTKRTIGVRFVPLTR